MARHHPARDGSAPPVVVDPAENRGRPMSVDDHLKVAEMHLGEALAHGMPRGKADCIREALDDVTAARGVD